MNRKCYKSVNSKVLGALLRRVCRATQLGKSKLMAQVEQDRDLVDVEYVYPEYPLNRHKLGVVRVHTTWAVDVVERETGCH